jgi:hypothetical protein
MPPKPKRSWFDIQMTIMTVSMASALGLWNLFASPDREAALRKAVEALAIQPEPVELPPTPEAPVLNASVAPLPQPGEKIMLGGTAPQTQVIVQAKRKGGGDGGGGGAGGGGGGGPVTSTSSS